jgi:hypothetical protein
VSGRIRRLVVVLVALGATAALGAPVAGASTLASAGTPHCVARAESHHAVLCVTKFDGGHARFRLSGFRARSRWEATTATGSSHGSTGRDGTSTTHGKHHRDPMFVDDLVGLGFTLTGTAAGGAHVKLDVKLAV